MIDVILEFFIVFEERLFGKKRKSKKEVKSRVLTLIVLIVLIVLLVTLLMNFYPLIKEE